MSRWSQRNRPMSDYQMVAQCKMLMEDIRKELPEYDDVKLIIIDWKPVVNMPEWKYECMNAIRVLENLCEDIDWEDSEDDEE